MSNIPIFQRVEDGTVENEENGNILGAEIILASGEEIVAIDVPQENQVCENEFYPTKKSESLSCDFSEGYIVMLSDGTFKILQTGELVSEESIAISAESSSVESNQAHNDVENLPAQISCSVDGCGKKFVSSSQLKVHQRKHNGMSPHECDFCKKKFSTGYALKAHKRTHTGEKPYICPEPVCQKRFKTSADLQKHIRTHTGERPFKCGICPKAFTTSNIRKVHMRVHTGEKPYKCTHEGCERRFSSATNFRNHLRTHTGEKPYVCSFENCQKRFTEYSSLYKHYTVHSQKKRFECSLCDRQYRQLSTLNIHINTIHKDKLGDIYNKNEEKTSNNRISPTFYKPIKPTLNCSKSNVISQYFVLHPKNGTLVSTPKAVTFKGEKDREGITTQQFPELQMKNSESFVDLKKDSVTFFPSIAEYNSVYASSAPSSCDKEDTLSPPIDFEPLKAITCGSEAILVLAVPSASDDDTFQTDSERNYRE